MQLDEELGAMSTRTESTPDLNPDQDKDPLDEYGKVPPIRRVLCMDGGGIFGLFTALMLKELCKANPDFLKGDDVNMYVGTSIGALSALALARAENPRDVVLSGQLESLITDPRLYNTGWGLGRVTGLLGLTSWTGGSNASDALRSFFGDITLGELPHRVMVTTFDMYGDPSKGEDQKWKARMFYNFPADEPNRTLPVWKVAYGAVAPVQWRTVAGGLTDGGIFADSPVIPAIAKVVNYEHEWDYRRNKPAEGAVLKKQKDDYSSLLRLRLLSMGVGNKIPFYRSPDFNSGYITFNMLPTNAREKFFWPPIFNLMLQPQVETAVYEAKALLNERFHRMDPGVLAFPMPPVLGAMYMSKYRFWLDFFIREIRKGAKAEKAQADLAAASHWLETEWRQPTDPPARIIGEAARTGMT